MCGDFGLNYSLFKDGFSSVDDSSISLATIDPKRFFPKRAWDSFLSWVKMSKKIIAYLLY
jgi:hypothetical protein